MYPDQTFYTAKHFGVFVALHPKYSDLLADKTSCSDLCRSIVFTLYLQWLESAGPLLDHVERTTKAAMTELVKAAVTSSTPMPWTTVPPPATTASPPPTSPPPTTTSPPPPATTASPPPTSSPASNSSFLDRIVSSWSDYTYHRDPDTIVHKCLFYLTLLKSVCSWLSHFLRVRSLTSRVRSQLHSFLAVSSQELTLPVPRPSRRRRRLHSTPNRTPVPRVGSRPASSAPTAAPAPMLLQVGDGGFVHPLFPWRSISGLPEGVARWLLGGQMNVTEEQLMESGLCQNQYHLSDISVHPSWSSTGPCSNTMSTSFCSSSEMEV